MLIPIIKDFNNNFSYLVSTSSEKAKEIFLSKALPAIYDPNSFSSVDQGPFEFIWTIIRVGFFYFINAIKYIISFQWLRNFTYLPISIPNTFKLESLPKWVFPFSSNDTDNDLVQQVLNTPNILQRYLFSNQTLTTNNVQGHVPYQDFLLGASQNGTPLHSWNLSFLSNDWFDPLTLPLNFLCSKNLSQSLSATQHSSLFMESNFLQNLNNGHNNISHTILMGLFICLCTGFSSFLNSFFIGFPFSLSTLLSLRYLIIQKFWAGCLSILGIVLGELTFMLLLILPPPFIQISLVYLESVIPYIFGLCLILFILIDILSNPYNYNSSLSQIPPFLNDNTERQHQHGFLAWFHHRTNNVMLKLSNISPLYAKIFSISFLLALTEESCFFSFFGCLNLSSTANFLDTYLFTASQNPIILLFSVIGFVLGSFLAINIYNLILAKLLFLFIHSGNYYFNRMKTQIIQMVNFFYSTFKTSDGTNASSFFRSQFVTNISNKENSFQVKPFQIFNYLLNTIKNLMLELYHFTISFLINFFPGGKRLFSLLSGKKELKGSAYEKIPLSVGFKQSDKTKSRISALSNKPLLTYPFFSSIETMVENNFINSHLYSYSSISATSNLNDTYSSVSDNEKPESSPARPLTSSESVGWKPTIKESSLATLSPRLYNKIDKILLTLLITLSFTTIPYYSFDYLVNSLFGFIPQDQILNSHSLRVNFPDYTNLLGITLSDKNSVINTDVSLYDRAHFMYGEWPNSFESLNYQGEFMWTNLRDHRRQKRTRRSTRLKFKTLKTKISTSWKEFKRSSGFSESINNSSNQDSVTKLSRLNRNNRPSNSFESQPYDSLDIKQKPEVLQEYNNSSDRLSINRTPATETTRKMTPKVSSDKAKATSNNSGTDFKTNDEKESKRQAKFSYLKNRRNNIYEIVSKQGFQNKDNGLALFGQSTSDSSQQSKQWSFSPRNNREASSLGENQRSSRFSETIQPLSTSSFTDLSGGEKYIKTYPKNWKKAIIEKYYQNPIYKTLLRSDLNPFLKREPKSQQLTNRQENELYFLRIKMAHYYDSLRFYFSLKSRNSFQANVLKTSALQNDRIMNTINNDNLNSSNDKHFHKPYVELQKQAEISEKSNLNTFLKNKNAYPLPPFQFKSMSSMNYRQQFKGTLKTVKQLFAISLHNNNSNYNIDDKNQTFGFDPISSSSVNRQAGSDPMETFYKYDKYLFNEHSYSTNAFLHEEAKSRKKPIVSTQSNISAGNKISQSAPPIDYFSKISSATKTIYNMFGSNDPFYVGWDQNLRKFVLTSRILPRVNALNRQVEHQSTNRNSQKSVQYYRPYTCWPFFKHQLKNLTNRSYLVLYENYLNILNKRVHSFQNINRNDIDTKSLTFLYSYSFKNNVKKYVSQLPINLYKQAMKPSSLENLFTPVSNARSSFLWPGAVMPTWEYAFASKNSN